MMELKYYEILAKNKALGEELKGEAVTIKVLSNIIVHQIKDILEYQLRTKQVPVHVEIGNYDNILQDALAVQGEKVIVFWEIANTVDQLPYKIDGYASQEYEAILSRLKSELLLLFESLESASFVFFNLFSSLPFTSSFIRETKLDDLAGELNAFIRVNAPKNFQLVNLDKVYSVLGLDNALDLRNFYTSKALYKPDFFKQYVLHLEPALAATVGKVKKALILDCDNTLWKGILGEDGFHNLKMSSKDQAGVPFEAIQNMAIQLNKEGVLLGLCSKNNPEDVAEVINTHPDILLKEEHLLIQKVNWQNKVLNLQEIAQQLNIGLDSLVFIDDSDFEVNLVREQLPQVDVYQVPKKAYQYPALFQKVVASFFNPFSTEEDKRKSKIYKEQLKRADVQGQFSNMEDFLRSLEIKLSFYQNDPSLISRVAQMTQKTNQYNLTTKRYTENDIKNFIESEDYQVIAMGVEDKFGDSGITGLAVLKKQSDYIEIDSFLMSCRIIGRNIEWKFLDFLLSLVSREKIRGRYVPTAKNKMVEEFYSKAGFQLISEVGGAKEYSLKKEAYQQHNDLSYLKIL